ncbi:MAG: hypothetical protein KDL87_15760, partial [Verrucomicrobiae bacterium]|nr:hypothetical protein [Verrucomicrobiae bacterium]
MWKPTTTVVATVASWVALCASGWAADLPQPVLGADLVKRLLNPATRAEAFCDFLIAYDEADTDYDWEWRNFPRDILKRAHPDMQMLPCPGAPNEAPLYLLTYETDRDVIWAYRNPPDPEAFPVRYPEATEERTKRREWAAAGESREGNSVAAWKPGQALWDEARSIYFLDADGRVVWPFGGDDFTERG